MSGSQTEVRDTPAAEESRIDPETERIARVNGWRPKEEFRGEPERWVAADVFVARGLEVPAILVNRNKMLAQQVEDMQRQIAENTRTTNEKVDEAVGTVKHMTTMLRTSEERAYARARRELLDSQERAVESGDTATWRRLEGEREALEKERPAAPAETRQTAPVVPAPTPTPQVTPTDPAVQRFFAENRWYDPARKRDDRDDERMAFADTIHNGLRQTRPDLTLEQNLAFVVQETRNRFPERFGRQAIATADTANGQDRSGNNDVSNNDRREDSPAVTPSSGSGAPRRQAGRYTFDTMPQQSKDQYTRYAKILTGKGDPLTKEEWARDYWAQFQDDGNP